MPVLQGRTREQLRVSIGYNLGAIQMITAATGGSTTTFLTDNLWGGADELNGSWWLGTDSPNDGIKSRVVDSAVTTNRTTLTLYPAVTSTNNSDTAELWQSEYDPAKIHEFINQAITESTGKVFDPAEDITLFADGDQTRFEIPSGISMIRHLQYRSLVENKNIDLAETAWTAGTNVTVSLDSKIKKQGLNSNKLVLSIGVSTGAVAAYKDFAAIDLSRYTHVEFWARSSIATSADELMLLLDNTSGSTSPIELLGFPALSADTWTFCRVALAKADEDTAISSVGIENNVDIGVATVWIDGIRAVDNNTTVWKTLPRHLWSMDKVPTSHILLSDTARLRMGYTLLKIVGGDKPALLSADATATEVPDDWVISRATELAFSATSGGRGSDPDDKRQQVALWGRRAEQSRSRFPFLQDVRTVT